MEQRVYGEDVEKVFNKYSLCYNSCEIYRYDNVVQDDITYGKTIVHAGSINNEYYMTKGHRHTKNVGELYKCKQGTCLLLLQDRNGLEFLVRLNDGDEYYVEPQYAHRIINDGWFDVVLETFGANDEKHDYNVVFKTRVFKN